MTDNADGQRDDAGGVRGGIVMRAGAAIVSERGPSADKEGPFKEYGLEKIYGERVKGQKTPLRGPVGVVNPRVKFSERRRERLV